MPAPPATPHAAASPRAARLHGAASPRASRAAAAFFPSRRTRLNPPLQPCTSLILILIRPSSSRFASRAAGRTRRRGALAVPGRPSRGAPEQADGVADQRRGAQVRGGCGKIQRGCYKLVAAGGPGDIPAILCQTRRYNSC